MGRRDVCRDNFLTSSRFSDGVYTGPAGSDRFVLEPVDGYAWQLRIRSRVRGSLLLALPLLPLCVSALPRCCCCSLLLSGAGR